MDQNKLNYFRSKLEVELARLSSELGELGRVNPTNPRDIETTYSDLHPQIGTDEIAAEPDEIDQADLIEEYEGRNAAEVPLEIRFNHVKSALERIGEGTYGTCAAGKPHDIEEERLEADPAATTCILHK
jgi:RNA polymerase-binding transcription factor DksA